MDFIRKCRNYIDHIKFESFEQDYYLVESEICEALTLGEDPLWLISFIADYYKTYATSACNNKLKLITHYFHNYSWNLSYGYMYSVARILKLCSKTVVNHYRFMLTIIDRLQKKVIDIVKANKCKCKICESLLAKMICDLKYNMNSHVTAIIQFMNNLLYSKYTFDGKTFGMMYVGKEMTLYIENDRAFFRDIYKCVRYIIPNTDISLFEFLFMDQDLTHIPILNHEELMVEKFKKLEHLIRDRCKKLKEIYDIHLIFNEKCPNFPFPENCTNHILKYCSDDLFKLYYKE